jgi:DNA-binding SARP family transcriptional activator/tetratricopeptide (TPR) repeat protein
MGWVMEFRVLGPFQVVDGDRSLAFPSRGKRTTVLVALLVHHNQVVPAQRLIAWLWGDDPPQAAAAALQAHVSRLRAALGRHSEVGGQLLLTRGQGYELRIQRDMLDAVRFESLVSAAQRLLTAAPASAASGLRQALGLWRGRALEGFEDEPFARGESLRLDELRLAAVEDLMEAELALGRQTAVTGQLQRLVAEHPTRERLTGQLMRALYRTGRQAEALQAYQRLRGRLVEELGIDPSPELRQVERAVLRQDLDEPPYRGAHLHEVGRHRYDSGGPPRIRLVGRDAEMETFRGIVEATRRGHGALVMLGGEPGVGKTRLTEEIAGEAARRGMLVLTGYCDEGGAPPHAPFVEIIEGAARTVPSDRLREALGDDAAEVAKVAPELHRIFSDIPPPVTLPAEHERRHLFNSVRDFIGRASLLRPLVLVLEDLHWADEATLALLPHVAEIAGVMPLLILGTYHDVEVVVGHPLATTLEVLARRHNCRRIPVRRLAEEGLAAMIHAMTGQDPSPQIVSAIYAETEGNPLFVEEVVRYLIDEGRLIDADGRLRPNVAIGERDVPDRVRLIIGRRLARLDDGTQRVLTAAAVTGREFSVQVLGLIADVDSDGLLDAIDEAENARIILPVEGRSARYRFAHELLRQTLVVGTSLPRRQHLHLRVAHAEMHGMEARDLNIHVAEVAHHLTQAGTLADPQTTVHYLAQAADGAMAAAAFEEVLRHTRVALELLSEDGEGRAPLLEKRAVALRSLGRWDEAIDAWQRAVGAHEKRKDAEAVGRLCAEMAAQLSWSGRFEESLAAVGRGLGALNERNSPWRVPLLALSGTGASLRGNHEQGDAFTGQAVVLAEEFGGRMLGAALLGRCIHHWWWGEFREAVNSGMRGAEMCRAAGDVPRLANGLPFLHFALATHGRLKESASVWDELQTLGRKFGYHGPLLAAGRSQSRLNVPAGDIEGMERFALDYVAACQETGMPWSSDGHLWLGVSAFWRGHWDRALSAFQEATRSEIPGSVQAGAGWAFRLLVRAYQGDRQGVHAMLQEKQNTLPERGQPHLLGAWTTLVVLPEALAVVGEMSHAASFYPHVVDAIEAGAVLRIWDAASLQCVAGICSAASEDWSTAERHYRTALRQADELPHRIAQPEVRRWFAQMLLSRDAAQDRSEARRLLGQAVEAYRRLGMPRHEQMAESLLAEAKWGRESR